MCVLSSGLICCCPFLLIRDGLPEQAQDHKTRGKPMHVPFRLAPDNSSDPMRSLTFSPKPVTSIKSDKLE